MIDKDREQKQLFVFASEFACNIFFTFNSNQLNQYSASSRCFQLVLVGFGVPCVLHKSMLRRYESGNINIILLSFSYFVI